jgi:hypothetical protein
MRNQVLSVEQMLNLKRLDISSAGMCWCYPIGYKSGYKKGLDEGVEIVLKELKERYNEEDNVQ